MNWFLWVWLIGAASYITFVIIGTLAILVEIKQRGYKKVKEKFNLASEILVLMKIAILSAIPFVNYLLTIYSIFVLDMDSAIAKMEQQGAIIKRDEESDRII